MTSPSWTGAATPQPIGQPRSPPGLLARSFAMPVEPPVCSENQSLSCELSICFLLLSVLRVLLFQAAQPRGQRAAPDPHPAARQPHCRRPGSLPAPAVESRPGHPQFGGHLIDRQQRVTRYRVHRPGWRGGRPGAVGVLGVGPSVGPGRRTLRSARPVKSGPRPADDGGRPLGAAGLGWAKRRRGRPGGPTRARLTAGNALRCHRDRSWESWPACRRIIRLLEKSGFQRLFSRAPGKQFRRDRDTGHSCIGRCRANATPLSEDFPGSVPAIRFRLGIRDIVVRTSGTSRGITSAPSSWHLPSTASMSPVAMVCTGHALHSPAAACPGTSARPSAAGG